MTDHGPTFAADPARLERSAFVARFGGVYEHSPWVAESAWDAGLPAGLHRPAALAALLAAQVEAAPRDSRLALLRAHPDLAGKLALAGGLTHASSAEQAGAGLDRCSPEEFAAFTALNAAYRTRFGFPYIIAVRGRDRQEILADFRARVDRDPETEFAAALVHVHRIALLRLEALAAAEVGA
ncbi:2-oxo-4-hydroxy-4-carboxy-5-ureidoimidazoline decarboxylase (plasmid) [Paroceanicella profunda]|uniref:2-oxo-4-hydroxy-4-carboxy-5-ureidoimidazoline decarboxylase n=1 Tax=Paroceanicella profunda TaxID=2579971 RepID=A0A5B8G251_9RHOB|nr:2-oxo-4-hydroxy-4-carboxy-5-ureidoimidazoline decarboxylase [Paroceanicella profunda]QDL94144.1 2-oxo-4-hydroxy-4-carboxy-5-ureidoimidazoline decarboxylase [Paroceanicella profunda]